ncbi:MAG: extracellular solute-binding protein [Limisphaerales bacterium]
MSEHNDKNWPKGEFARHEVVQFSWWIIIPVIALLAALLLPVIKMRSGPVAILYCAQDQEYAEPLLKQFEQETGIRVKAVYDSEAVKTVGLANRLLAERNHPRCDIFWGNEELRTRQLAAQNVFRETNGWAAFGHRSRRIVVNTNLVTAGRLPAPASLLDLTNSIYRGQVALAFPQFGTTGTHMNALRQHWGETGWLAWCRALIANEAKVVDGNSVVVKLVGRGEAAIGLTDSDDVFAGQRNGLPVAMLPLTPSLSPSDGERVAGGRVRGSGEMLLIPNTVAVIRNAPHPEAAQRLFEWLQKPEVARRLVEVNALESAEPPGAVGLQPDWPALLRDLDATTKQLNEVFLK